MKSRVYTLLFMAAVGLACGTALAVTLSLTRGRIATNEKADGLRHVLRVLGIRFDPAAGPEKLLSVFRACVEVDDSGGAVLYRCRKGGAVGAVALPVQGPGLWGEIRGLVALEPDMRTIRAVSFYQHEETPGLGGDISTAWFQQRFEGRSTLDSRGRRGIRIVRVPGARGPNEIDGITGATMTCRKLETLINEALARLDREATP